MSRAAFAGSMAGSGAGSGAGSASGAGRGTGSVAGSVAGRGTGSVAGSGAGGGTTHINMNTLLVVAWRYFGTHMDALWYSYGHILALMWTQVSWTLGGIMEEIIQKNQNRTG